VNKAGTEDGCTPLCMAAHSGHAQVVRLLLDGGADMNKASTKNGHTPLFVAAHQGKLMALQCLLDDGAETNLATAVADDGQSPLYAAAEKGFLEVVRCLIVCGANVNAARSDGGGTPLGIASQEGYYNVALILLKGGAVLEATHARTSSVDSLPEQRMLRLLARWRCATCDRPLRKEKTCDRCRSVSYCSRECQRGDWAQHEAACTPQAAARRTERERHCTEGVGTATPG
jgi:ankyrin repeat protein